VICEAPDERKYQYILFPESDYFGAVFPADSGLAEKDEIAVDDLAGLPLFSSEQSWENDIRPWAKDSFSRLHLEGSFRLSYNASIFAREHLGYLLAFDHLIDTSAGSGLVFRPLRPKLETTSYLVWKKHQTFSPIAERFLTQIQTSFSR
jgi:DNA-binding transcriptional LysR family regulator